MFWLNRHTRFRNDLSAYADGALSTDEVRAIEAHLAGCEACRTELDELRAIAAAVRDVPHAEAPRSFALTPQMLERRASLPPVSSAPPFMAGMRLASAAVAVALTVVVIGDLSSAGNGNGGDEGAASVGFESAMQSRDSAPSDAESGGAPEGGGEAPAATRATAEYGADDLAADRDAEATPAAPATGNILAMCPSAGETAGEGAGVSPPSTPITEPAPTSSTNLDAATSETESAACLNSEAAADQAQSTPAEAPAKADDGAGEAAATAVSTEGSDGVSTLRVTEIVLAGALIALLAGVALDFVRRRRAAA